jgi:hypothetical protein
MTDDGRQLSPQRYARAGGALYLVIIVTALVAEVGVRGGLVVSGDAAATAANITRSSTLFRLGLASDMLNCVLDVAVAMILYALLRPVDRNLALLAAFLRIVADAILAVTGVFQLAAMVILGGADYLRAFDPRQLQSLAYLSLDLHGKGYGISLIFFGLGCEILGFLVYRSGYLPRFMGVLLVIAGAGYLFNSFAGIVSPPLAASAFPWTLLPGFVAELALSLWLVCKGVNMARWDARWRSV